jgi:ABC-type sugar transport system substrate-binding protein
VSGYERFSPFDRRLIMMKRFMCGILALIASTTMLFAFGSGAKREKKVKIGFLAPTLQTEFFISIDDGLKAGTKARGWDYVSVSFDNDSSKAVTAIENMVTGQCSIIIAMVSDSSCDAALKVAQKEGVKIMECGVQTSVYDICLNTDQRDIGMQIGAMASDWINSKLSGKANIVVYTTYQNQDMQRRGDGIIDSIKKHSPNSKILEVVDIGKDVVGAGTSTTENMLQKYPNLNVIACYGDAAAVESMEAVKAAGVPADKFGIFSCDGTERALKGIATGSVQRGTVQFAPVAPQMLEYCERVLKGEKFAQVVMMETHNITAANISQFYTVK